VNGPLLSVIVATWNRPDRLHEALKSISLQRADVPLEVIVVNDGGTDVGEIAGLWARVMAVQYVQLERNSGLAHARNEGIRRARGDILCFLDDDDVMLPGHLRTGAEQLGSDVDVVRTHIAVCDQFVPAGSAPTPAQVKARYAAEFDERLLLICNFVLVHSVFIRRRNDVRIAFDTSLSQLEDWDLWLRLRQQSGYRFKTVPLTTAVYHRVPGFNSMTSPARESASVALGFRATFREIVSRYPSDDEIVVAGRALHDHFYSVLAQASENGVPVDRFAYERFVECMAAFAAGSLSAAAARERIAALAAAAIRA
jgi:hypothetical protein